MELMRTKALVLLVKDRLIIKFKYLIITEAVEVVRCSLMP